MGNQQINRRLTNEQVIVIKEISAKNAMKKLPILQF